MQNLLNKLLFSGISQSFYNKIQNKEWALSHIEFTERFSLIYPFLRIHCLYTFKDGYSVNNSDIPN